MISLETGASLLQLPARKEAVNASKSQKDSAAIVASQNTIENLKNILEGPTTLKTTITQANEQVTVMEPTAPYGLGVMIVAGREYGVDEQIKTETIYDYSSEAQEIFWSSGMHALRILDSMLTEWDRCNSCMAVMTENCISTISTEEHRTSRSIALPHAQVFITDTEKLQPIPEDMQGFRENLQLEQALWQKPRIVNRFLGKLQTEVQKELGRPLKEPEMQTFQPFGYSFSPSQSNDIKEITEVMQAHHAAYTKAMGQYESDFQRIQEKYGRAVIPQPSYRLYSYLENGIFTVTVSPEVFSHSGVLEAAGILPIRSIENPPFPEEEREQVLSAVREKLPEAYACGAEMTSS